MKEKKAIVHDVDGNRVVGEIVYQRKADYGNWVEELDKKREIIPALVPSKGIHAEENDKLGKAVKGRKGIIHDIDGNEIVGEIIYVRKALYKDPFEQRNKDIKEDH